MNFGMQGDITDVITHAKLCQSVEVFWGSDTPKYALLHSKDMTKFAFAFDV